MKNMKFAIKLLGAILILGLALQSCKKDNEPVKIQLSTIKAGDIDLNAATPPNTVPVEPTIVASFNTEVENSTVNASNITLTRDYDDYVTPINVSSTGRDITITPSETLANGALYELSFNNIMSMDNQPLESFSRAFTTEGTFSPSGAVAYWNFENNANDVIGDYDPDANGVVGITYTGSRNADAGQAATFDGDVSIIEIPDAASLSNTHDFTLSFWIKTNSNGHVNEVGDPTGHFVLGLGGANGFQFEIPGDYSSCKLAASYEVAGGTTTTEDLWFNGSGEDKDNGGWQGWDFVKDLTGSGGVEGLLKDKWAQVICVYNGDTKKGMMYINGQLMKSQDFNLWPAGDAKRNVTGLKYAGTTPTVYPVLAFGFIHSRQGELFNGTPWGDYNVTTAQHFKGQLDDVRIFHKPLTAKEIELMYNSEKP